MSPEFEAYVKLTTTVVMALLGLVSALLGIIGKKFVSHVSLVRQDLKDVKEASVAIKSALAAQSSALSQQVEAQVVAMDALRAILSHQDPQLGLNGIQSIPLLREKLDSVLEGQSDIHKTLAHMDRRLMILQAGRGLAILEESSS